jgi:hypothetical protein
MKSIKEKIISNQIIECEALNNLNNSISVYIKTIQEKKEYYINITISKKIFKYEEILTNNNVPLDIYFILHITPNFPINRPRLFCLTSLRAINLNLCDAKDLLNLILKSDKWDNRISAKDIILRIPDFLNDFYQKNKGIYFIGEYDLDFVYDYKILSKIPYTYLNEVDQIINEKTSLTERRLLMITDLFFLIFTFERGVFSYYNNLKLIFWASIKSIFGMKNTDNLFQFEFSKTENQRIFLFFKTQQGTKIMDLVLENLRCMGIDYSINKKPSDVIEKEITEKNTAKNESKLLPKFEILDKNDNKNQENSENNQESKIDEENKENKIDEENKENKIDEENNINNENK